MLPPEWDHNGKSEAEAIADLISNHGSAARKFKTAPLFLVTDSPSALVEKARDVVAWISIRDDVVAMERIEESQRPLVASHITNAQAELADAVWNAYSSIYLLGEDQTVRRLDLGVANAGGGRQLADVVMTKLEQEDEVSPSVGPQRLVRGWPAGKEAWPTREVRDLFYSSPKMPRLVRAAAIKEAIVDGVREGVFAYAVSDASGFDPLFLEQELAMDEVEISDSAVLLRSADARRYIEPPQLHRIEVTPSIARVSPRGSYQFTVTAYDQHSHRMDVKSDAISWAITGGEISENGLFTADTEGAYDITARVERVSGSARAVVQSPGAGGDEGANGGITPTGASVAAPRWRGQVERRQWFEFGRNVLSRAGGSELFVEVSFEIPEDASPDAADSMKAALESMGLESDMGTHGSA